MKNSFSLSFDFPEKASVQSKTIFASQTQFSGVKSLNNDQSPIQINDIRLSNQNIFFNCQETEEKIAQMGHGKAVSKQKKANSVKLDVKQKLNSSNKAFQFDIFEVVKILFWIIISLIFVTILVIETEQHIQNSSQIQNLREQVQRMIEKVNQQNYNNIKNQKNFSNPKEKQQIQSQNAQQSNLIINFKQLIHDQIKVQNLNLNQIQNHQNLNANNNQISRKQGIAKTEIHESIAQILEISQAQKQNQGFRSFDHQIVKQQSLAQSQTESSPEVNQYEGLNCNQYKTRTALKYGNLYQFSVNHQQLRRASSVDYFMYNSITQISQQKFSEAINLLPLIHNLDQNGLLNFKNNPCQNKTEMQNMIKLAMKSQTDRLNSQFQIDQYHSKQLRFCIVANSYRNAQNGLLYRNIDSILQQDYTNYHVVYTDDFSPDRTGEVVVDYLKQKKAPEGKFKVKINSKKVGMMENIYNAITFDCELGEIVVMLDGDDSFVGRNVLSLLNAVYQKQKVALMWNNFLQIEANNRVTMGFSRDYNSYYKQMNIFRQFAGMISSHLKSFYVDLFRKIKVNDLKEYNGQFFGGASDTVMMISMLEMANPKIKYVPQIVYQYRFDTGQVGMGVNRNAQQRALQKLSQSSPYKPLQSFEFVDKSIENVLIL